MPKKSGKTKTATKKKDTKLERPLETAAFFGFNVIKAPDISREDTSALKSIKDPLADPKRIQESSPFAYDALEKLALLRFFEKEFSSGPTPVFIAYKKPLSGTYSKKPTDFTVGLEIIGLSGSTAEGILLRAVLSMIHDEGFDNISVNINSLGDKDSVADFERMVLGFVRKHMNGFPADIRKMAKNDIFDILRSDDKKHLPVQEQAPKSMSFLSEHSRNHLKEVFEYIESFDVPYHIAPRLIGSPTFCSQTIFEVVGGESGMDVLALGYHYSRLCKKAGMKKELPALGATISFKKKDKVAKARPMAKPKFYLIQLGFDAKLHTLKIMEELRRAQISIFHSFSRDKLGSQMASAENMKVPYLLIVGQKEALENSVTVRDVSTRVQETISLKELVGYLKKLK